MVHLMALYEKMRARLHAEMLPKPEPERVVHLMALYEKNAATERNERGEGGAVDHHPRDREPPGRRAHGIAMEVQMVALAELGRAARVGQSRDGHGKDEKKERRRRLGVR